MPQDAAPKGGDPTGARVVQWSDLRWTAGAPAAKDVVSGLRVALDGYMVPLEDGKHSVTEFLVVPSALACIHVPVPTSDQIVFARMRSQATRATRLPIRVTGDLRIADGDAQFDPASRQILYSIDADIVEEISR